VRRIPFQLKRFARAALGVLGAVAILLAAMGPVALQAQAAPLPDASVWDCHTSTSAFFNQSGDTGYGITWPNGLNYGGIALLRGIASWGPIFGGTFVHNGYFKVRYLSGSFSFLQLKSSLGGGGTFDQNIPHDGSYLLLNASWDTLLIVAAGSFTVEWCDGFDSPTPTPTNASTPTNTATAGPTDTPTLTSTAGPSSTPGPSGTPGPTPTQPFRGGNLIRNWDFNNPPIVGQPEWGVLNRVIQAPVELSDPINVAHLPKGSCGPKYWDMSTPAGGIPGGTIFQEFAWPGGPMYLNFEAVTDSYLTYGRAKVTNVENGNEYAIPIFTNGSNAWTSFKFLIPNQSAGRYRLTFAESGIAAPNALVVDNVNVRTGYWGNDCPPADYQGSIPPNGFANPTAQPLATATYVPPAPGQNLVQNCDFENSQSAWVFNDGAQLQSTGGATGPNWTLLFNYQIPFFPPSFNVPGQIYTIFDWAGGQMYLSFFLKDNSQVEYHIRNLISGFSTNIFTTAPASSPTGWTKITSSYLVDAPGQITLEFDVPSGATAGIDGVGVASGSYATGACAQEDSPGTLATQAAANSTATQAAATSVAGETATSNAQQTADANAFATYFAGYYGTATAIANAVATEVVIETETQAAVWTETEAARSTATAQGTAVASATATPWPTATLAPTIPPPATYNPPPATLTAVASGLQATETALAASALTQAAAARQTAAAAGTATAYAVLTANAAAAQQATNQAAVNQTAQARQTTTAAAATQAQATYNAGVTQTALAVEGNATHIAAATQTQAALQTQTQIVVLTANYNSTQRAAGTQTALAATGDAGEVAKATQTQAAHQTATAGAATQAQATSNANGTQAAHATGTVQAAATQTALVATSNATSVAAATLTAVATVNAIATEQAQASATAQAQGTLQAQGTAEPVPPRPEPAPYVDCDRPTNPLALANWMDYEVCRVLTWFVWSPDNSWQVTQLQIGLNSYEPLGTLVELTNARDEVQQQLDKYDWARTGLQEDDTLMPNINVFFPNHSATGLLAGNLNLTPNPTDPMAFLTICSLQVGDIFGDAVAKGLCASINWMIAIGIMGWVQFLFDVVVWLAFIRYAWYLVTVTLPAIL